MTKLGIYGGTFSPPHNGHVKAAEKFINQVGLDRLLIMPANIPPHKELPDVSAEMRYEMANLAFNTLDRTEVSDFELKSPGKSYTVNTLEHFKGDDIKLYMLCGTDMFVTLDSWYRSGRICELAVIVLAEREKGRQREVYNAKRRLRRKFNAEIMVLKGDPVEISSTEIREYIAENKDISSLVPENVAEYIAMHGLYSENKK